MSSNRASADASFLLERQKEKERNNKERTRMCIDKLCLQIDFYSPRTRPTTWPTPTLERGFDERGGRRINETRGGGGGRRGRRWEGEARRKKKRCKKQKEKKTFRNQPGIGMPCLGVSSRVTTKKERGKREGKPCSRATLWLVPVDRKV